MSLPQYFKPLTQWLKNKDQGQVFIYPSAGRRVLCMALYSLGLFVIIAISSSIMVSIDCLYSRKCSNLDRMLDTLLSGIWLVGSAFFAVKAWRGELSGCRKKAL
jgi:hypothetical protein